MQHLERGEVDSDALLEVARQIGACVSRIAAAGLFHRDLKLSNLVIEEDGTERTAWVIDPVGVRRCRRRSTATFRMLDRRDVEIRERRNVAEGAWSCVLREALRSLSSADRQEVLQQLREHPRP